MTSGLPLLGQRALNRALLERQLLLRRAEVGVPDAVAHLVAVQAQVPDAPYPGLWSRVAGFDPHDLGRRVAELSLVRMPSLRATMHLVTPDDALALPPLVKPLHERVFRASEYGRGLAGLDLADVVAAGLERLRERPMMATELGRELAVRWPGREPVHLGAAVVYGAPLLQVPPRGVWGRTGRARLAEVGATLGRPIATDASPDRLVLRYLRAFGPAGTADVRTFTGLGGIREVVDRLDLRRFTDERGRTLYDVPDGPLPDLDTPAPPRFLGEFDNALLGHDDRTRILAAEHRSRVLFKPVRPLLVDGMAAGMWTSGPDGLVVRPLAPLSDAAAAEVVAEGERMLDALWPDAERAVRFEAPA
ncbi:winged helix DNA-binding domain-containing protein [Pseudonocardia sp. MH-G8]|uniref:winged helix DNA-binding domain-containing protein n=1 Tax=Pseudonocardia sp. MH-G8 TaxID=1854588 RepID=UPI0013041A6C|nr:winged helix DNA-binding domain-containing protein [Pseudonocardia sp. MH-G8]